MSQTEKVVYKAKPGRYVVQEQGMNGWEYLQSFETLDEAQWDADDKAKLFLHTFRVVDRGDDDE